MIRTNSRKVQLGTQTVRQHVVQLPPGHKENGVLVHWPTGMQYGVKRPPQLIMGPACDAQVVIFSRPAAPKPPLDKFLDIIILLLV